MACTASRPWRRPLYADYYGIDHDQILELPKPVQPQRPSRWSWRRPAPQPQTVTFGSLCQDRAQCHQVRQWSVAVNGAIIEQSQILTTDNLAALVANDIRPSHSWAELANLAYARVVELLVLARKQEKPLATIKDAAYAWRQTVFFLSLAPRADLDAFLGRALRDEATSRAEIRQLLGGLVHVVGGGQFDADGVCPIGRRLLGWTTRKHWVLEA